MIRYLRILLLVLLGLALLTVFFFLLFANLLGLIPYGSTATGNVSVTATMAIPRFMPASSG